MPTVAPSIISQAWPSRPKPVTSVQALTPASIISSEAVLLRVAIHRTVLSITSLPAVPPFAAVFIMPVPSGLVRMSLSPALAPLLRTTLAGWMVPVTESPYFSSWSSTLCPPTRTTPASRILSSPPAKICFKTEISIVFTGKQTMFIAVSGLPPIA